MAMRLMVNCVGQRLPKGHNVAWVRFPTLPLAAFKQPHNLLFSFETGGGYLRSRRPKGLNYA